VLDTKNDVITLAWNLIKEKFMCSKIILLRWFWFLLDVENRI
jgi:hypothetical protein